VSRAYGLTSLTYALVPLASVYVLGEQLRGWQTVGVVLIVMGIACLLSGE
jgi:drug/metabolite transporter (DMT)-like permease